MVRVRAAFWRVRLLNRFLVKSWLGTTTSSLSVVSICTERQVSSWTWPMVSSTWIQSPGRSESSKWNTVPAMRLIRVSWTARPITTVITADVASTGVMSILKISFSRRRNRMA